MTAVPTVRRVFGDGPFAEIGRPRAAVADDRSDLVAVGGHVGRLQWNGRGSGDRRWIEHRIGVYERDGLRCRHLVPSREEVNCLAFHPVLPLLAVGTGGYDGGYSFTGELLLVRLDTGEAVSVLPYPREVVRVEWQSPTALRLTLAPCDDWQDPGAHRQAHTAVIERPDWARVGHQGVAAAELNAPAAEFDRADPGPDARRILRGLAARAGREWTPRTRVGAVEALPDGRVLAALDGVLAEAWLPSGERQWAVPDAEGGRGLLLVPDRAPDAVPGAASVRASVWANAERLRPPHRAEHPAPRVARLSADDGSVLETVPVDHPVTLVAGGDRTFLRPVEQYRGVPWTLLSPGPDGPVDGPSGTGFLHDFQVRHATRPYLLVGFDPRRPYHDKWVTTVGPDGTLRRLFPHAPEPGGPHASGPAAETGQSLVYAGTGGRSDESYVVRRSLTDGSVLWRYRADSPATALDTDGELVHVARNDATLVTLDAADGSVRRRTELRVHGLPTVALSLVVAPAPAPGGGLYAGTADGRILHLVPTPPAPRP
ncbi:PQQ-binding-like beta-propeller repeat protein [Streptomyces sp. NRRL F-2580]|uniref:outer membrane protein assembly factor BamB family protein n=1 Tax=Streptomyces sp. NRRL F-2580 TaxID=1463841 RepID=UPI0004C592E8|nr:PQQ-binding-like beta-propeller repeat protein [Streptomyces sp. NRRL F-2580]